MLSIQPDPHHWSVSGNFHASYAVACFTPLPRLVTVQKIDNQINRLLMLTKLVRNVLGAVIVLLDRVSRPRALQRSPADQQRVQSAMDGLSLYQLRACPFCVKTRRAIHSLGVDIELRDINKDSKYREQLHQGGGQVKVPCLRIEDNSNVRWMYESDDIIAYLNQRAAV